MSYIATVWGHLAIDPPLKWSDIRESRFLLENQADGTRDTDVVLHIQRDEVEHDDGVNTVITCKLAAPCRQSFDCRGLEEDTEMLVKEMLKIGRTVRGELIARPHDSRDGDVWRVVVDENGTRSETAKLQWPDGSEVELP